MQLPIEPVPFFRCPSLCKAHSIFLRMKHEIYDYYPKYENPRFRSLQRWRSLPHRHHTNGHRVRCRGSQRARLVRRAAPPGAPLCAVRSPRASHAAPRSSPSRREEAPDGTARARCGARIAEPRGRPAASRSCSSRCVSIHPPVPHVIPDRVASSNPNSDARTRELGRQHGRSTRGPDEIT